MHAVEHKAKGTAGVDGYFIRELYGFFDVYSARRNLIRADFRSLDEAHAWVEENIN